MSETNNNNAVATVTAPELNLFQFSTPTLESGSLVIKQRKNEETGAITGVSMTLPPRKDVASRLGVTSKDGTVTAELRKMSDALLTMGMTEFQNGMRENKITGARFAKTKSGRLTLSAIPVEKRIVSQEQLQAAFLSMTPAERKAFLAGIKGAPKQDGITIEAETGKKSKRAASKKPTPQKSAAKTDEQTPEAQPVPEQPAPTTDEPVPALDNQASELPEATAE